MAVYGWPIYFMFNKATGCCKLAPYLKCKSNCCCFNKGTFECFKNSNPANAFRKKGSITSDISERMFQDQVSGDNCCACNYAGK